jgi:hypothetical protein
VTFLYENALIISIVISNHRVHRVLVNDGNSINILSMEIMVQVRILFLKLTLVKTLFIGIKGSGVPMNGALESPVMMDTLLRRVSLQ